MLGWWRRWRERKRRAIFKYWDGEKMRYADPLALQDRIWSHADFDSGKAQLVDKPDKFGDEARADTLRAIREGFEVEEFNDNKGKPRGLTQAELWDLFERFTWYLEALKKNIETSQTTEEPSGSAGKG